MKFRRYLIFGISIVLILSLIAGCSSNKSMSSDRGGGVSAPSEMPAPAPEENRTDSEQNFGMDFTSKDKSPLEPKKVIVTVNLSFETTEFEKSNEELAKLVDKYKAYVENSNISYNHYYNQQMYRYGEYTIRVPKENLTSFKTELNAIGHMVSESTNKQDVTKQYQDTESRLRVITTKEERILSLLQKAEKIEDIIALENQLSETIYEKENLKASLLTLDDKVDYSTLYISIQEVKKITDTETVETTFGQRIANAFKNSLYAFRRNMENLLISAIYMGPTLIVLAIIIYGLIWIVKKAKIKLFRRKNKNDKTE